MGTRYVQYDTVIRSSGCRKYIKSRIDVNTFNTFNNVPGYNVVIEFNGIQHYQTTPFFNNKEWTLEDQQIRDATLVDVLQRQGIRLLVIKYDDINRIQSILKRELQQK